MASNQAAASGSGGSAAQEFIVRAPKNVAKKYSVMRFNASNNIDFTKFQTAKIARENNLKEYKTANDIEDMPKFGAGSEFGKEQRDEARRKKYGMVKKRYNPEEQPWLLKLGSGKQAKKFKGTTQGGVAENASYYIFTQGSDGAFDAFPVSEWHNFSPSLSYKYLNAEEAEEEFSKRDKTMNYFSVMLKKRIRNEGIDEGEEVKEKVTQKKKSKDFMLTEMEDWADMSDSDGGSEAAEEEDKTKTKKKKKKFDSDEEAVEESDDGDLEDKEVDYMSDTSKSDTDNEEREGKDIYNVKGVEDEEGLRTLNESDEDEEETEKPKEENQEKPSKQGSESESSSSSESDSDDPESGNFASALFMQKKKTSSGSRSNTPTPGADGDKGKKRKGETDSPVAKKVRTESPVTKAKAEQKPHTPTPGQSSNEGITEDSVKRYLSRKPMTTKDLLQKFKSKKTGLSNEHLVTTIAAILKKLNPNKEMIKGTMYLSIKE